MSLVVAAPLSYLSEITRAFLVDMVIVTLGWLVIIGLVDISL